MGEVEIKLPSGGTAVVKGTPSEIAEVLRLAGFAGNPSEARAPSPRTARKESTEAGRRPVRGEQVGPQGRVDELITEGLFKSNRSLGDVRDELKRRGHTYKAGDLSPVLVRLVRGKKLRRSRDDGSRWTYVEW